MGRSFRRWIWTALGVATFVFAVIALVAGRPGPAVLLLIVCVVCLGTAMVIARRAARRS